MLAKAKTRAVYDELVCAELAEYLAGVTQPVDLAVAADVFVYIGDLDAVFARVAATLRPGGMFAFSVESTASEPGAERADYRLLPTHRYAHSPDYVRRLASRHGFGVETAESAVIRKNGDADIVGQLVLLRRG
jgi:predicted TPR repeat methyltransferase